MKPTLRLASILLAFASACAFAQDKPVELRFATVSPQKSVWGQQYERIARAIEDETRGSVKLQLYFGGQLGSGNELVQQVARGRIDVAASILGFTATLVPELQVAGLPMYYRSEAEHDCVIDSALHSEVTQRLAGKGVQLLGWTDAGTGHFIGKKPYPTPAEVRGTKAATFGTRSAALFWEALGANTVPVTIPEQASAFQTGLIDLAVAVPTFYVAAGQNKVAPVLTKSNSYFTPAILFMHKPTWDALSPEQRAGVQRAFARMPAAQLRAQARDAEERMLQAHVQGGGQVLELSPAQRDAFRRIIAPQWPRMVQEAGTEGGVLFERIEAARKACEKTG